MLDEEGFEYDSESFAKFISDFSPVLMHFYQFALSGEDVKLAYDLHVAWNLKTHTPEEFTELYDFFVRVYPNPDIQIEKILNENGFSRS